MQKPTITLLAQRDFGQKINATFQFVGQNFKPLAKVLLYIAGPPALLAGIANGLMQSRLFGLAATGNPLTSFNIANYLSLDYLAATILAIVTSILTCSATYAFLLFYEEDGNSLSITPKRVWEKITQHLSALIIVSILASLLIIVLCILLVIPGIYAAIAISLCMIIIIRENASPTDSLQRSHFLVKGKWWSTFGLIVIMSLIASIISGIFQIPNLIITTVSALSLSGDFSNNQILFILSGIFALIGGIVMQSLLSLALSFQYYNLVEMKEGVGLKSAIDSIGNDTTTYPDSESRF